MGYRQAGEVAQAGIGRCNGVGGSVAMRWRRQQACGGASSLPARVHPWPVAQVAAVSGHKLAPDGQKLASCWAGDVVLPCLAASEESGTGGGAG